MVKGKILSRIPEATIIDISHEVPVFNPGAAAFILRNVISSFPRGTIYIIDITSDATIDSPHVVVQYEESYFIGTDNGIFSLTFSHPPEAIYEIEIFQDSGSFTFVAYDLFIKVAEHIAHGKPLHELGNAREFLFEKIPLRPVTGADFIKGHVIYIDHYENVFTNIDQQLFLKIGKRRPFRIIFGPSRDSITKISRSYKDVKVSEVLALFSYSGFLQIAVCNGNAAGLFGLKLHDKVVIEFFNPA